MNYKKIYFVGIKGVGMAALAVLLRQFGYVVGGCDVEESFITDPELQSEEILIGTGFDPVHLVRFVGETSSDDVLLVVSAAHGGMGNPIVLHAKKMEITAVTYAQALGKTMSGELLERSDIQGISVAGAHGKTTISAMLASCLELLRYDPSFVVGTGSISPIGSAGKYGKGKYFVAEADEYASDLQYDPVSKFVYQHPKYLIINNIDFDHPDFFKSLEDVMKSFEALIQNMDPSGILFVNGDDPHIKHIDLKKCPGRICMYGVDSQNDYIIRDFAEHGLGSTFSVETKEMKLGDFSLSVPGYHNAKNVLPVIAFLIEIGVSIQQIVETVKKFGGTKRRLEKIGVMQEGTEVFDDYAHHPQEIKTSLAALKSAYPDKKIMCIFQPHTVSRTQAFQKEFAGSFTDADELILLPVFASAREKNEGAHSVEETMKQQFELISKKVLFMKDMQSVIKYVRSQFSHDACLIVTMGAGDVYKIGYHLVDKR